MLPRPVADCKEMTRWQARGLQAGPGQLMSHSECNYGRSVRPIRYRSHSRAAPRPSLMAQTTRLWPRRQSPAAKTPVHARRVLVVLGLARCCARRARRRARRAAAARARGSPWPAATSCAGQRSSRVPGTSFGMQLAVVVALPLDVDGHELASTLPVVVADELLAGREIDARVGAEVRRGFLLAVVELVDLRPLRPGVVRRRAPAAASAGSRAAPGSGSRGASRCRRSRCRCRRRR